jgi:hypothetical protein
MESLRWDHKRFDPEFCGRVVRIGAVACVAVVLCEALFLAVVDSANTRCPGWVIPGRDGNFMSAWVLVAFVVAWAVWICVIAVRWRWFSQRMIDRIEYYERSLQTGAERGLRGAWVQYNALNARDLHFNWLFVAMMVGSVFIVASPFLILNSMCA